MDRPFSLFTPSSDSSISPSQLFARDAPAPSPSTSSSSLSPASSATSTAVGTTSIPLLYLWLSFQLLNQILLPILVVTFVVSKSVKRHCTVVNVCLTWIVAGVISSLLWYAGKQSGPEPPKLLCTAQATLLIGVPPMTSVAVLALMYQMNTAMRHAQDLYPEAYRVRNLIMISLPYAAFICFSLTAASLAVHAPQNISRHRRFFYCSFNSPMTNAFAVFTALILLAALAFAVATGIFLRKNWAALRQSGTIDLQFLGRMGMFVVYVSLTLILSVVSIFAPRSPFPDLATASVGTVLALILGSQPDVYRAWFRRSRFTPSIIMKAWKQSDNDEGEDEKRVQFDVEKGGRGGMGLEDESGEEKGKMKIDEEIDGGKHRIRLDPKAGLHYDLKPSMHVRVIVEEHQYNDEDLQKMDRERDSDDERESAGSPKEADITSRTLRPYSYF